MKPKVKVFLIDTLYYIAGSILYALAIYTFAKNAQFAPGGVSGLALIINAFTKWPIGIVTLLINVPIIILCAKFLGKRFLIKSLWTMLINTFFMDIIFPMLPTYNGNPLLAALFAGVLLGAGLAIIYMRGSSTGGSDFVLMAIKKKWPHFSVGQISLVLDLTIILLGGIVFKNVDAVLYGVIASFGTTAMMDYVLYGTGSSKLAIIVSVHGQAIADAISDEVERGSTIVPAKGAYTGEHRDMVYCVCAKREIYKVRSAAHLVDPDAMVMITDATEVFGEGFVPPEIPGNEMPPSRKRTDEVAEDGQGNSEHP